MIMETVLVLLSDKATNMNMSAVDVYYVNNRMNNAQLKTNFTHLFHSYIQKHIHKH